MATLSYDFSGDTPLNPVAGWSLVAASSTYSAICVDISGNYKWRLASSGSGDTVRFSCDAAGSSVEDAIISGKFIRRGATSSTSFRLRHDGSGHGSETCYSMDVGNNYMIIYRQESGSVTATIGDDTPTTTAESEFNFKFEVTGTTIRGKVWSGAEPGAWNVSGTDSGISSAGLVVMGSQGTNDYDDLEITSDDIEVDVDVTPTLGTLDVEGYSPGVTINSKIDQDPIGELGIGLWSASISSPPQHTVTVNKVTVVQSALGTLEVEGYDPVIVAATGATNSPVGTLEIEGFNPSVTATTSTSVNLYIKFKDEAGNVHTRQLWVRPLVTEVTTTYTAQNIEEHILADATGGAFTITMPTASGREGYVYTVKKTDSSANAVKVDGLVDETIDGDADFDLEFQDETITLVSDGSDWWII